MNQDWIETIIPLLRILSEHRVHQAEEEEEVGQMNTDWKEKGPISLIVVSIIEDEVETNFKNNHQGLINPIFSAIIVRDMVILHMNAKRNK